MYTAPASIAYFGDVIQYVDYKGVTVTGKVERISYHNQQSGANYVNLTLDNGQVLYTSCKTIITILEMADANSRARTRNWPENWDRLGIKKVS